MTVEMFVSMLPGLRRVGRKGATIKSLSDSLDVSIKTVRCVIDEMVQLDLPIVYEETDFGAKVNSLRREDIIAWIDRMSGVVSSKLCEVENKAGSIGKKTALQIDHFQVHFPPLQPGATSCIF